MQFIDAYTFGTADHLSLSQAEETAEMHVKRALKEEAFPALSSFSSHVVVGRSSGASL